MLDELLDALQSGDMLYLPASIYGHCTCVQRLGKTRRFGVNYMDTVSWSIGAMQIFNGTGYANVTKGPF